jgi:hypothetical protein
MSGGAMYPIPLCIFPFRSTTTSAHFMMPMMIVRVRSLLGGVNYILSSTRLHESVLLGALWSCPITL